MLESVTQMPIPVSLPPIKDNEVFNATQWATILSMCEVFIPSIAHPSKLQDVEANLRPFMSSSAPSNAVTKFFAESATDNDLKEALRRRFAHYLPATSVHALSMVLSALNTRAGLLIMTGGLTPLQSLSLADRTTVICGWSQSYLSPLRAVYASVESLTKVCWLPASPNLHQITGFPVVPEHEERNNSFEFKFTDYASHTTDTIDIEYDILIIGSGCGAGVIASHLARNTADMSPKPRIAVLEKAYHFPSSHFPMPSSGSDYAGENLMEAGGILSSNDGSISVLAGSTWGGGGTVNWSASLQPQHFVREEWEAEGLDHFTSPEFQNCLDTVCDRMGVERMNDELAKSKIPHNFGNHTLLEGSRKLGMTCEVVPQNSKGLPHKCGYCSAGCASATKQGPANCWFPDAAKYGVEFIEGCYVHEILWDDTYTTSSARKARGVRATWSSRNRDVTKTLIISSPRVIVSGGTLNSPVLLLRSGLTNHHIGANLHLHPTIAVGAVWRDRVRPWDGPILTTAVTSFENTDGQGHGPKIEMMTGTPAYMLPWAPFNPMLTLNAIKSGTTKSNPDAIFASALDYKMQCAKYAHTTAYIVIQRDRDTGRVYLDSKDPERKQLRIAYTPSKHDRTCMIEGLIAACRIAFVQGALEVRPYAADIPPFIRSSALDDSSNAAAFKLWLADVRRIGINAPSPMLGSAHQMGTCRMSTSAERGVVDSQGRVFGTKGLYVCDASVFPSASGVNPMVTTMGIAEWIGRGLVRELKAEIVG